MDAIGLSLRFSGSQVLRFSSGLDCDDRALVALPDGDTWPLAIGFVVALPFVAAAGAMILCGRSSSRRGERNWHVALPWLLAASAFVVASVVQSNVIVFAALTFGLIGFYAAYGPFFSLPSLFLRGTAAAGGVGLFNTLGSLGGFFGPVLIGVLKEGSGEYATGMAAIALGFVLSALIVLAVGRTMAPRRAIEHART